MVVRFAFTREALKSATGTYLEALSAETRPPTLPEELRTYIHELTHYLHYSTTPYRLFQNYCRGLQNELTVRIVRALLNKRIGFQLPLLQHLPVLEDKADSELQIPLAIWLNTEYLLAVFQGDVQRRIQLEDAYVADLSRREAGERPRFPPLQLNLARTFALIQYEIAEQLERLNTGATAAGHPLLMDPAGFDKDALRHEIECAKSPSEMQWQQLRNEFALFHFGDPQVRGRNPLKAMRVESIIESAATAAEYWDSDISYDEFAAWSRADLDPRLQSYRACLAQGLNAIQTRDLRKFILTYLAVCDFAMFGPVLPHHAPLRMKGGDFQQILPVDRWIELTRAACDVEPMDSVHDHGRYMLELFGKLNWVAPSLIVRVALDAPEAVIHPVVQTYLRAQRWRANRSYAFLGIDRYLLDSSTIGDAWCSSFDFVIKQYSDVTTYHPDRSFVADMLNRYLVTLALRCIMLGNRLTIASPYRAEPAELKWMSDQLREAFRLLFGRDFPMLRVSSQLVSP